MRVGRRQTLLPRTVAALLLLFCLAGPSAAGVADRLVYIDPRLGGWIVPLERIAFEGGAGELYFVSGIYFGPGKTLNVVSRSKVSLRRFELEKLQRFADHLVASLEPAVVDMHKRGFVESVLFTFYATHFGGDLISLEVYDSCVPARKFSAVGALPLCVVERRQEERWSPW